MSFSRQSRFMRSMTPSGSIKMSTSRFNMVCGKTVEQSVRPNLDRIPNPQPPKMMDARVMTPTPSRRERERSLTRDNYGRPPVPPQVPTRDSSLYVPFGSYAEIGAHTRPGRYASTSHTPSMRLSRRSVTPGPGAGYNMSHMSQVTPSSSYSASRRNSVSLSSSSVGMGNSSCRQRHYSTSSAAFGTPAANRGIPFY